MKTRLKHFPKETIAFNYECSQPISSNIQNLKAYSKLDNPLRFNDFQATAMMPESWRLFPRKPPESAPVFPQSSLDCGCSIFSYCRLRLPLSAP